MKLPDIKSLPEPVFFKADFNQILLKSKQDYENQYFELTGENIKLEETDREMIMLRVWAYRETLFRINANLEVKKNLLFYADGIKLDHLGEFYHVKRLPEQKAHTIIRFEFQQPLPMPLFLNKTGIKSNDNQCIFYLLESKTIAAGTKTIELAAKCSTPGQIGNDYAPGTITKLITPLPYVDQVYNSSTSSGGADRESDLNYRERIYLKPDSISTTGSEEAYIFFARSAHQDIIDVSVDSPAPGLVHIFLLLKDGIPADQTMLNRVKTLLENEEIKTFTDQIHVFACQQIDFKIKIKIQIYEKYASLHNVIMDKAISQTKAWKEQLKINLGKDIVPEEIIRDLQAIKGVYRIIVESPQYQKINVNQVAIACSVVQIDIIGAVNE